MWYFCFGPPPLAKYQLCKTRLLVLRWLQFRKQIALWRRLSKYILCGAGASTSFSPLPPCFGAGAKTPARNPYISTIPRIEKVLQFFAPQPGVFFRWRGSRPCVLEGLDLAGSGAGKGARVRANTYQSRRERPISAGLPIICVCLTDGVPLLCHNKTPKLSPKKSRTPHCAFANAWRG